ncbi:MAG: glycosyltransferase [Owenweeksia sp.]
MSIPKLRVLFICSWYPSRENPHLGNFIQRHAVAVASIAEVTVIAAVESDSDQIELTPNNPFTEVVAYYTKKLPFWSYYAALRKAYQYVSTNSSFDIIHVNVAYPAGVIALRLKKPYVVTEHFTGYLPASRFQWNPWQKWIAKKVLGKADLVLPVSQNLGHGLQSFEPSVKWKKVSNVVQAHTFYPAEKLPEVFTFLHISTLNEETKNINGLLQAFKKLDEQGVVFKLKIGGDGDLYELDKQLKQSGISEGKVETFGAQPSKEIARLMREAHVFVLASHVENQPCVILEALCSGIPVVSTRVGGIHEEITEKNGILVTPDHCDELAEALSLIQQNYAQYNRKEIADTARKSYSYEAVATTLKDIYLNVLNEDARGL